MATPKPTAILLVSCPDQRGIVAALSTFITQHNGNIIALDQYVDVEESAFFARMEWELDGFAFPLERFAAEFEPIAQPRRIQWTLHRSDRRLRMAVMVSKQGHCLYDILARHESGEWPVDIALVLSNHDDHRGLVERHGLPFVHVPMSPATKAEAEARQIELLRKADLDFIVLARYMQILSPAFVQAGATAHFVTEKLDEGPIIEQDVIRVSHRQGVDDLVRLGRDLEKIVLARAIYWHLHHRLLVYKNRTVVFS